jgi:hypothetical protein
MMEREGSEPVLRMSLRASGPQCFLFGITQLMMALLQLTTRSSPGSEVLMPSPLLVKLRRLFPLSVRQLL